MIQAKEDDLSARDGLRLLIVDVFAARQFGGNPAAVIFGAGELMDEALLRIARFMSFSETVFLLPPTADKADFLARTFTVRREIPFAGHAALAAAHAFCAISEKVGRVVQECAAGLLPVDRAGVGEQDYIVELPPSRSRPSGMALDRVARSLGLSAGAFLSRDLAIARAGPPWLLAEVADALLLSQLEIDYSAVAALTREAGCVGLVIYSRGADGIVRLRSFAPAEGIFEDPVCGSCAAAIAAAISPPDQSGELQLRQGAEMGHAGQMTIYFEPSESGLRLRLKGSCKTVISGRFTQNIIL